MTEKYVVPTSKSVAELLTVLYGDDLKVEDGEEVDFKSAFMANYICDDDKNVALCMADNKFVANSGSSMMMIPAGAAQDAAETNDFSQIMLESYYEVINILSRALMDATSGHLRLDKLSAPGENAEILEIFGSNSSKVSFSIDVPGYGPGNVTFVVA